MAIKINQKIIDYGIESREETHTAPPRPKADVIQMHEKIERPEMLLGSTYKIRTPLSDHALYVTINDVVLNAGTEHEQRRPVRDLHQLEEHGALPVDRGAHANRVRGVSQGR